MSSRDTLATEARVAFSRGAQPHWFRVAKWIAIIAAVRYLWGQPSFWWWVGGASVLALTLHLLWRVKTRAWTQPWGGWDDVDTAQRGRRP
jgi:hypothetical protein